MKLFSRHPDDSTGSVRGGVLQAPSTYVKMRIAAFNRDETEMSIPRNL
jgi:hypothetical protein